MSSLPIVRGAAELHWPSAVMVIVMAVASAGCGGTKKDGPQAAGGGPAAPDPAAVPIDPDTAITVDAGRISVASPTGWSRAERSKDYIVKYQPGRKKVFPAIIVTAADAPAGLAAVTAENHAEFAAALATRMSNAEGRAAATKPAAVTLGQHFGAAWSMPAAAKAAGTKAAIDQQCYAVIVGERMYTITATAPKGKLDAAAKATARAVAAAIGPPAPAPAPLEAPAAADEKPPAAE